MQTFYYGIIQRWPRKYKIIKAKGKVIAMAAKSTKGLALIFLVLQVFQTHANMYSKRLFLILSVYHTENIKYLFWTRRNENENNTEW